MKKFVFTLIAVMSVLVASAATTSFEVDLYKYTVTQNATSSTQGEVTLAGLSTLGKGETGIIVAPSSTVIYNGYTYKITAIAANAFENSTLIKAVITTNAALLTSIGESAFSGCTNLISITTAASIGQRAFAKCTSLSTIQLKDGVKTIGIEAFRGCTGVNNISIPSTVTFVSYTFVDGCSQLSTISVASTNSNYYSYDGMLFQRDGKKLLRCPMGKTSGDGGEYYKRIYKFPPQLETIGDAAFSGCRASQIRLPVGTKTIGIQAFANCTNMTQVVIPNTVRSIGSSAFFGCASLHDVVCNVENVSGITMGSNVFQSASVTNLLVPYGKESEYKAADQWKSISSIAHGSYDLQYGFARKRTSHSTSMTYYPMFYTITDRSIITKNGETYYGKAKWVRAMRIKGYDNAWMVPDYIEHCGRKYLVTSIGSDVLFMEYSYYDVTRSDIYIGENVDTIQAYAFNNASVDTVHMAKSVQYIGESAFNGDPLKGDLILPYGIKFIGGNAFNGNKFGRILIPSSLNSMNPTSFKNSNNLSELYINASWIANFTNWNFSGALSSMKVFVPVGSTAAFKGNSVFSGYKIYAGAYDFTRENEWSSNAKYLLTVTSASPVTVGGVTYDGKAKYVYNPYLATTETTFRALNDETNPTYNSGKRYLVTEFGDSVLSNSNIAVVDIANMNNLTSIGAYAFTGSKITSFTVPATCTYIGKFAFAVCTKLSELTLMQQSGTRSWGGQFFGGNASNFTCYVKWTALYSYQNSAKSWIKLNGSTTAPVDQFNGYIESAYQNFVASVTHPVDWSASGLSARIVNSYSNFKVSTKPITATPSGEGVLLTGVNSNTIYKLKRPSTTPGTVYGNYLEGITGANLNIYSVSVGYYFNQSKKKFVRPSSAYTVYSGYGYLDISSNFVGSSMQDIAIDIFDTGLKGDVDGNGVVDITDANILINIVLGKDTASKYGGRADVTGEGDIDVSDINAVLNIILGK